MPPIDRRRRRRHLSRAGALATVGVAVLAVVVAVVVGGLTKVHAQSRSYERAVDRSYAAQARLVVEASNREGRALDALVTAMPGDDRAALEVALDTLVRSSATVAAEALTAGSPAPSGGAGAEVAAAMADRQRAMETLRAAVDRLLGMSPLPVEGSPDPPKAAPSRPISRAQAAAQLSKTGALLVQADRLYAAGRSALRRAPGHSTLPSSTWLGKTGTWTSSRTLTMAGDLSSSATLAPVHRVELVRHTLSLTPAPVPSGAAAQGPSVIPPTGRIRVAVVVENEGNVGERGIVVGDTVAVAGEAARPRRSRRVSLAAGSSKSVELPSIPVVPDRSYTVVVTVDPPVANVAGTVASDAVSVHVAPPGPATVGQLLPTSGREKGGTDVTILGSGFTWVSAVTFGSVTARYKVVSSTQITATAPPGTGTVDVRVTNPGGVSTASPADRYRYRRR